MLEVLLECHLGKKLRLFFSAAMLDWGEERVRKTAFLVAFDSPK